jgi:hypothetical protein
MRNLVHLTMLVFITLSLALAPPFVGAIQGSNTKVRRVPMNKPISVTTASDCTTPHAVLLKPKDTVEWQPASGVQTFKIHFDGKPFEDDKQDFDENNRQSKGLKPGTTGDYDVYKYSITVNGSTTCDPHVIIIGGRPPDNKVRKD